MTSGIDTHPHVVLRLECGQFRAALQRVGDSVLEVIDADLEVQLHLLHIGATGPDRRAVVLLVLTRTPTPPPGSDTTTKVGPSCSTRQPNRRA